MKKVILLFGNWSKESQEVKEFWLKMKKTKKFDLKIFDVSTKEGADLMDRYEVSVIPVTIIDGEIKFIGIPDIKTVEEIFDEEG
uniref:Thioredoxin-like fold domain-containing protein n=1 Tax=candidate division WOR-3 bacterium TaxID=2052148 RepID=A0A7C3J6R2_UNCW3